MNNNRNPPTANDINQTNELKEDTKLFNKFKDKIFTDKKYINRENLICINSGDRDWMNELNEHRYSFQTRFKPERDSVQRIPKMVNGNIQRNSVVT